MGDWATLYVRIRSDVYERIRTAAAEDDRAINKWVEIHFRDFFKEQDRSCESPSSSRALPPSS